MVKACSPVSGAMAGGGKLKEWSLLEANQVFCLLFASWQPRGTRRPLSQPPAMKDSVATNPKKWDKWPWPENVIQNKPFLFKVFILGMLS